MVDPPSPFQSPAKPRSEVVPYWTVRVGRTVGERKTQEESVAPMHPYGV